MSDDYLGELTVVMMAALLDVMMVMLMVEMMAVM